jgi:hypothetical protein
MSRASANKWIVDVNVPGLYHVPYRTNTKFHGRPSEIERVWQAFPEVPSSQRRSRKLVLYGFPGIGKTSIAVEYAEASMSRYEGVFWVTASSREAISSRYALFDQAIKGLESQQQTFFDWCASHHWLLVIDNLDDASAFNQTSMIPPGKGDVLITTRQAGLSHLGTVQEILPLKPEDATQLLLMYAEGRCGEANDEQNACHIAELLGRVPLAIRHCGSLVSARKARLSSYKVDFDKLMTRLVIPEETGESIHRFDLNDAKPILGTFELSYSQIQSIFPDAVAILQVLANIDQSEFSYPMLERCFRAHRHWDENGNAVVAHVKGTRSWMAELPQKYHGEGLQYTIDLLVTYSMIFPKAKEDHYFVHPVRSSSLAIQLSYLPCS